jgi:hypothetical protein
MSTGFECFRCGGLSEHGAGCPGELYDPATSAQSPASAVDMVNKPPHYQGNGVECIEAIQAALTPEEFRGYLKGNAMKYIWRERTKGQDESVQKAEWYLKRLLTPPKPDVSSGTR